MIPLRDTTQSRSYPVVNITIIVVNCVVYFVQAGQEGPMLNEFIMTYGPAPARYSLPAIGPFFTVSQQLFSFISFMFLHGGNLFENPATVQFFHRTLAWTLAILGLWLWHALHVHGLRRRSNLLLAALAVQFGLGILTILRLPDQPVLWGATHQAGAVALLIATVLALHAVSRDARPSTHH